jgi:LacI family transcriptional regulator
MYHYSIILSNSDQRKEKELILINTLLEKQVDGLLFMGGVVSDDHIEVLRTSNVPIVLSATNEKEHRFPSVDIDHTEAAKEAVQFLIDEGNRRVAMISGPLEDPNTGLARFNGYKQAMEANGLPWKEDWVRIGNYKYDSALQATRYFLNLDEPPTAIFAANDEMAIGAVHAIQDAGLRVPEDIEVMGFDGIAMASMVRPLLTTVAQPMYDIGAVSMRLLTKLINKEEVANPTVRLQHELWIRQSTKKKRG